MVLTVVAVAVEQRVVPGEGEPAAELWSVGDEHLLDGRVAAHDRARSAAHAHHVHGPVPAGQLGEPVERPVPVPVHHVHGADDRVRVRAVERTAGTSVVPSIDGRVGGGDDDDDEGQQR